MSGKTKAFTLVELLVVIGIITVLVGILLPVISRVRRHAMRVACASNMRQVAIALRMYADDYKGWLPAPAEASSWLNAHIPEDWVHWQSGRDITQSRIWSYVKGNLNVLKCPVGVTRAQGAYPFSYAVNGFITGHSWRRRGDSSGVGAPGCKLIVVVQPSHKILVAEPNSDTIADGVFSGPLDRGDPTLGTLTSAASIRHDAPDERTAEIGQPGHRFTSKVRHAPAFQPRTNVVMVDGHCEFIERWKPQRPYYSWPKYDGPLEQPANPEEDE